MSGAKRFVTASERSVFLCAGVAILARRNHAVHGSSDYFMAEADWDYWVGQHPELEAKARAMQADAFDFCNNL